MKSFLLTFSFSVYAISQTLPDDINISLSESGIVPLPNRVNSKWDRYGFVRYTKLAATNGGANHIVAQDRIRQAQIIRARNVLDHFLTDFPGSKYGHDKCVIANAMADNEATLLLLNGRDDGSNEPDLPGQWLFEEELAVEGSDWYMNNIYEGHRDATFEEILHLVHDTGIGVDGHNSMLGVLPEYQMEIRKATIHAMSNDYHIWPLSATNNQDIMDWVKELDHENSLTQEYLASVIDSYYGLWGAWQENPDRGMWGLYIANDRFEIESQDPEGLAMIEMFFTPFLKYEAWIDSSFNGTFSIAFNKQLPYTHKSQYLLRVRLNGSANANIIGNGEGNRLIGNRGNNFIQGGAGVDSVIFQQKYNNYSISHFNSKTVVVDNSGISDGIDTLISIEYLVFKDRVVSSDKLFNRMDSKLSNDYTMSYHYPNSFIPSTSIRYELPQDIDVKISNNDILGKKIKTLVNHLQNPGNQMIIWDGTDELGKSVNAGVYFCLLGGEHSSNLRRYCF